MKLVPVDTDVYDSLLGKTYAEIGSEARAMHKCQGFGQLLALPGPFVVRYILADATIPGEMEKIENSTLDGLDLTFGALSQFAGAPPPQALVARLDEIAGLDQGRRRTPARGWSGGGGVSAGNGPAEGARPQRRIADAGPPRRGCFRDSASGWRRRSKSSRARLSLHTASASKRSPTTASSLRDSRSS